MSAWYEKTMGRTPTASICRQRFRRQVVFPQPGMAPAEFEGLAFRHFFLQPMDGPHRALNTQAALQYCLTHPRWRLSLQTHKLLGIP